VHESRFTRRRCSAPRLFLVVTSVCLEAIDVPDNPNGTLNLGHHRHNARLAIFALLERLRPRWFRALAPHRVFGGLLG
jgi:hypothetical protein